MCTRRIRTRDPMISSPTLSPLDYQLQLPNQRKILAIYAVALLMYTVASPDPDPNPRGGGQLPNHNECNSTLTSGTKNIYPYPYIDVNDRSHRSRSGSPVTNLPGATMMTIDNHNNNTGNCNNNNKNKDRPPLSRSTRLRRHPVRYGQSKLDTQREHRKKMWKKHEV